MTLTLAIRLLVPALAASVAALLGERALRYFGSPGRWAWLAATMLTLFGTIMIATGGTLPFVFPIRLGPAAPDTAWVPGMVEFSSVVLIGWLGLSLLLSGWIGYLMVRQWRQVCRAEPARLHGEDVLVAETLGPAVVGIVYPEIVVPRWFGALPARHQELIIAHEEQHRTARDPLISAIGLLAVCLVPWNPFIWFHMRRLNAAIELDCDARVLCARPDIRPTYGKLLIGVAERRRRPMALTTPFSFNQTLRRGVWTCVWTVV